MAQGNAARRLVNAIHSNPSLYLGAIEFSSTSQQQLLLDL